METYGRLSKILFLLAFCMLATAAAFWLGQLSIWKNSSDTVQNVIAASVLVSIYVVATYLVDLTVYIFQAWRSFCINGLGSIDAISYACLSFIIILLARPVYVLTRNNLDLTSKLRHNGDIGKLERFAAQQNE